MNADQTEGGAKRNVVLIVEDDAFLVKAYQVKFEKEGIEAWISKNGQEALNLLDKDPPRVILLDLMLPGVNGWEVLGAMRNNEKWRGVPIIILSNLGQPADIEKGKQLGATDYIVKANARINEVVEMVKKYF